MQSLTITRPEYWHVQVCDGELLQLVVPDTARRFSRAIIMPNLDPPVSTTDQARRYRDRILAAFPAGLDFKPLMTLYLTEETTPDEVARAKASSFVHGVKWYPAGATTNAHYGVSAITRCYPVLAAMEQHGLPLLIHAKTTDPAVDTFDREVVFIDRDLALVIERFPSLKVVVEHLTTRQAVQFVQDASPNVAATITAHHLLLNRTAMFPGGLRPHLYCLPVLKREEHRLALVEAAVGGHPRFFLGTDSAPHSRQAKESVCGCAGIYTAHAAIELYAEVFEAAGALGRLEAFASFHGADFYGLPRNSQRHAGESRVAHARVAPFRRRHRRPVPRRRNRALAAELRRKVLTNGSNTFAEAAGRSPSISTTPSVRCRIFPSPNWDTRWLTLSLIATGSA